MEFGWAAALWVSPAVLATQQPPATAQQQYTHDRYVQGREQRRGQENSEMDAQALGCAAL